MYLKPLLCYLAICTASSLALNGVRTRTCNDCTKISSCPDAQRLFGNRNAVNEQRLKDAFCGFSSDGTPMECCTELSDEDLTQHPNYNLLPKTCGSTDGNRIHGGTTAGIHEFPWMVLISYKSRLKDGVQFECGGSLINERYVLTAAHCVNKRIAGVRVGENDIRTKTDCQGKAPNIVCETHLQDIKVQQSIVHPNYQGKPNIKNDIALLRLKKPADISLKNAGPVCLPLTTELRKKEITGINATVTGWGYTETGYTSAVLLKVGVPVHSHKQCKKAYSRNTQVDNDETQYKICAGEYGKDSCGGDSGGPLMIPDHYRGVESFIQYGIVSYGPIQCGSEDPGVYTDVTKYLKWILDHIEP